MVLSKVEIIFGFVALPNRLDWVITIMTSSGVKQIAFKVD